MLQPLKHVVEHLIGSINCYRLDLGRELLKHRSALGCEELGICTPFLHLSCLVKRERNSENINHLSLLAGSESYFLLHGIRELLAAAYLVIAAALVEDIGI